MVERILISDLNKSLENLDNLNYVVKNHLIRYLYAKSIISPNSTVLDIACGSGYGSKLLASIGHKITAVDISSEAINFCKKHNDHPLITWKVGDIKKLRDLINNKFDAIVCFETLEHIESGQEEILEYFKEIVNHNDPVICSIPLNHPDEVYHKRKFTFEQRDQLFKNCFKRVEYPKENASLVVGWK